MERLVSNKNQLIAKSQQKFEDFKVDKGASNLGLCLASNESQIVKDILQESKNASNEVG